MVEGLLCQRKTIILLLLRPFPATICIGAVLNALGSAMKFIGRNRGGFPLAVAGNGLGGLAQCFILFVPPTLAATWFGEGERGMASAIGMLMNMLGVALGYLFFLLAPFFSTRPLSFLLAPFLFYSPPFFSTRPLSFLKK